jgi:hypothetical protein
MKERKAAGIRVCNQTQVRTYIVVAFTLRFHEPDESDWSGMITSLSEETGMNKGSIKKVFQKCRSGDPNPELQAEGAGRHRKLQKDNPGLIAAALALNIGAPPKLATQICNDINKASGIKVCRNTLIDTLKYFTNVDISATARRKTGSKDKASCWAIARKVFSQQIIDHIQLGEEVDEGSKTAEECELPPLYWDGILWADENHVKQVIGGSGHQSSFSGLQYRISVNPKTGDLQTVKNGGKMPLKKLRTIPKYPQEARACYAVAAPVIAGKRRAQMGMPWSYTGRKLLSYKAWKTAVKKEMAYRRNMKKKGWAPYKTENPYLERYGDAWEEHLELSPALKKFRSVHHLVDHLIADGNRIFKDTNRSDTWMIYHDHLKIFWEKETLDYIKSLKCPTEANPSRTWYDRLIKITGKNNARVHNRYKNCLPGDSPELMPLDCHLFCDIKEGLAKNIALSYWMKKDDPRKYDGSTPHKIYSGICRTLSHNCPVEERMVEDIDRIKNETLQRIVDADGTYIEDSTGKGARHGVRLVAQRDVIKTDPDIVKSFDDMFQSLQKGTLAGGVPCMFDLTGDGAFEEAGGDELVVTTLENTEEEELELELELEAEADDDDDDDEGF